MVAIRSFSDGIDALYGTHYGIHSQSLGFEQLNVASMIQKPIFNLYLISVILDFNT